MPGFCRYTGHLYFISEEVVMMKKKSIKRVTSAFLSAVMLLGCLMSVCAVNAGAATARWVGIFSIDVVMGFDGDVGTVSGVARKQTTASMIEGTLYVYMLVNDEDWVYIDEWYNSKTRGTLGVEGTFPCESGATYKAVFVVTAYTDGVPETETVERIKVCP